jgi:hypothetical protein
MNPRQLFSTLALTAVIAVPCLAVAQPNQPGYQQQPAQHIQRNQLTGIIQSVQGSSFTLDNGRTVFMHQGTVINPTGIKLRAGMQVTVYGALAHTGHGAFNANEIDVVRRMHHM